MDGFWERKRVIAFTVTYPDEPNRLQWIAPGSDGESWFSLVGLGVGEIARHLTPLTALPEDPCLVHS